MLRWVLWAWWNLMIISNESMDSNDPKDLDDPQLFDDPSYSMIPQLFDDQLEAWTLIIQKSMVIPPSARVLFSTNFCLCCFLHFFQLCGRPVQCLSLCLILALTLPSTKDMTQIFSCKVFMYERSMLEIKRFKRRATKCSVSAFV